MVVTSTSVHPRWDSQNHMRALQYCGTKSVSVNIVPRPLITDETDAIVRIIATTICGSDLHLYENQIPETHRGDILGHEAVGIVEMVGKEVKNVQPGMRVCVSAVIACGKCRYCMMGRFSNCDTTNPSHTMEAMYGHRTAGLFGYSHLTGGYPGLQAEVARVPFADVNLLPLDDALSTEMGVLLSDVACTAWQAAIYSDVGADDEHRIVAVWGAGPVGLTAAYYARHILGASRVIVIDNISSRLEMAKQLGCETINFDCVDSVTETLRQLVADGPDCVIDATGFRYAKSLKHKLETILYLETDSIDALAEAIYTVRKSGTVSIIGDYIGYANHFPIGAVMEKGLVIRSGQLHCQSYWKMLQEKMLKHEIDLSWLITHRLKFQNLPDAYSVFDQHREGMIKPIFFLE